MRLFGLLAGGAASLDGDEPAVGGLQSLDDAVGGALGAVDRHLWPQVARRAGRARAAAVAALDTPRRRCCRVRSAGQLAGETRDHTVSQRAACRPPAGAVSIKSNDMHPGRRNSERGKDRNHQF